MDLVNQRYSAPNEIEVLQDFVDQLPIHYVSPKVYRSLADAGLRKTVLNEPMKHIELAAGFQRFDQKPENTGIPALRKDLHNQTEHYINSHFWNKTRLDFEKEVGLVARFFRGKRVGIEQRLADKGSLILELNEELGAELLRCVGSHLEATEVKVLGLKRHFENGIGTLLDQVAGAFGDKARKKLQDWLHLHWASLRCAGRKNGQHITSRGYEIDFNGELADFCVEALNSSWIVHRAALRKQLLDDLRLELIPELQKVVAQAKGQDAARIALIESTYEEMVEMVRHNLDLTLAKYDEKAEEFDALRPKLALAIRTFLQPTYEGIAAELGKGSSVRMRNRLNEGVQRSIQNIGGIVKDVVRNSWEGLTSAIEKRISEFFDELEGGFEEQASSLKKLAEHPSEGDEDLAHRLLECEQEIATWIEKEVA
jgi:hypothetical protein